MASAAAVAADVSRSPLPAADQNDELGTTGFIGSRDSAEAVMPSAEVETDTRDVQESQQAAATPPFTEEEDANGASGEGEDLFGSDEEDDHPAKYRQLDDEELDSGDDEDRGDRVEDDDEVQGEDGEPEVSFLDVQFGRHPIPEPSDGELYLLKMPKFISIEPYAFQPTTFQPPVTDHHSRGPPSSSFSAYHTALSTIRWRRSPSDPSKLQSNARFLRWSDGSLTLQLASTPKTQYVVSANALAPPQQNPRKPTPTSQKDTKGRRGPSSNKYDPEKDSFTYLTAPQEGAQIIRITNKITAGLKVQPPADGADDALEQLQQSLAEKFRDHGSIGVINITEDPELAKKKAEVAEKEKMKAQRRREVQELRDRERAKGLGSGRSRYMGGLTVGALEGDDETGRPGGRSSGFGTRRSKPRRPNRRGEIYSDEEEEFGRRVRTKEDEYDEEDDFVAKSDEEEEVVDDDDDDDDGIGEIDTPPDDMEDEDRLANRPSTPKRNRDAADETNTAAAGGLEGSPLARSKRRRVIEDDEEDE